MNRQQRRSLERDRRRGLLTPADPAMDGREVEPDRSVRPVPSGNPVDATGPDWRQTAPPLPPLPPKPVPRKSARRANL